MLLLPADSTILVCTRVPLVSLSEHNGTVVDTGVCKGAPCIWATYELGSVHLFTELSFEFDAGNQFLVSRRFFAVQYAE